MKSRSAPDSLFFFFSFFGWETRLISLALWPRRNVDPISHRLPSIPSDKLADGAAPKTSLLIKSRKTKERKGREGER